MTCSGVIMLVFIIGILLWAGWYAGTRKVR